MSQMNTLFNYFTKTPTSGKTSKKCDKPSKKSPQSNLHKDSVSGGGLGLSVNKKHRSESNSDSSTAIKHVNGHSTVSTESCFKQGDLVWARLDGYPWWPSLVCDDPTSKKHVKTTSKHTYVHVQFFDEENSHAWIRKNCVKDFKGSEGRDCQRGGLYFSTDPGWFQGTQEADKALKMAPAERVGLVAELQPSTEEESEEEPMQVEAMHFDSDIFDAEVDSEREGTDKGRQNENNNNIVKAKQSESPKSPKKTPEKSPKKGERKSSRPSAKRRRIVESNSDIEDLEDSEDEFKPGKDDHTSSGEDDVSSGVDEAEVSEPETESDSGSPVKSRKRKRGQKDPGPRIKRTSDHPSPSIPSTPKPAEITKEVRTFTPSIGTKTKSKLAAFSAENSTPAADEGRTFTHLSIDFLEPEKIRDGKKRSKDHPDYDPRTLYIPDSFLRGLTPGLRQWWELKAKNFDTVLFFKMGKFYELYHMDAVIIVNELGLLYMKGDHAHAGFPEISFGRYSDSLIQKGYKVARIEQTETPDMMSERCKSMGRGCTKFDKVVKRELCSVQTKGTKRYSFIDGDVSDGSNAYLLAVTEKFDAEQGGASTYGVCFVDTSIGKFHIGQFEDDRHCSRFRTLVSHYAPAQVLYERGKLTEKTQTILNNQLSCTIKESLQSGTEFWDSNSTLKFISESDYFLDEANTDAGVLWPETLKQMMADTDALGQAAADDYTLAVSALGALIWYLRKCLMDQELLSMRNFDTYVPVDNSSQSDHKAKGDSGPEFATGRRHLVLDAVTLANLDVLLNSSTGTTEGSLFERLDQCATPFGKRLLKQWLCAPLCNPVAINDRLDAMEDLIGAQGVAAEVTELLKKLPDLERLLSKIHTLGSSVRSKNHPDSRAIFFEDVTYSKRKIEDFISTLNGFKTAQSIIQKFKTVASDCKSKLLRQCMSLDESGQEEGHYPDLSEELEQFDNAFDHEKARKDGTIKPSKGVDPEYDTALSDIKTTTNELNEYLDKQRKRLGCRNISYFGTAKNRFQMEIPDNAAKNAPHEYELTSQKKGYKRYRTREIERLFSCLVDAEDRRDSALKDTMRRIFYLFDTNYRKWERAVQSLSVLDVLLSLAKFSQCGESEMCRPLVTMPAANQQPYLEIREGRHPCISRTFSGGDFIPNDTVVGMKDENDMDDDSDVTANSQVVLVTGPNMGGKSTLMRQVGVIVVIAQLGCYVPAESCKLSPVDRVFTRLGASDRIMAGESTFFVEVSETASILQHATAHSLVLLDELGRGTATYDGTAIACAVVNEISQNIKCRTLFSTHYHSLVEEFSHDPNVRLGHMACMVENENEEDPSQETITFLYKFVKGACPKSYGFNAAKLADLPDQVISVARAKAKQFEESAENISLFRKLHCIDKESVAKLADLQNNIQVS